MNDETARTLITCCATLGGICITQFFTNTNLKSKKNESIYKQQYDKLFAPIHKILFFSKVLPNGYMDTIYKIIFDNYSLASELLVDEFMKCYDKKTGLSCEFCNAIRLGYNMLRNKLGYANLKMVKTDKENAKKILSNTTNDFNKLNIILFLTNLFSCMALVVYTAISLIDNKPKLDFMQQNIFILITLGIQLLSICVLGGRIFR